jgi:methylmalonyl-CoA mutase
MNAKKKQEALFNEFPSVSTKDWEAQITADLKGADYEKRLVWNTSEKFKVKPYYRSEDLRDKGYLDVLPGESPYVRGNETNTNTWEIRQDIIVENIEEANQNAVFIVDKGITSLGFRFSSQMKNIKIKEQKEFSALLKNIPIEKIGLYFICGFESERTLGMIINEAKQRNIDPLAINGAIDFDPLGHLTEFGNFYSSESNDFNLLCGLINNAQSNLSNYRVLGINGNLFGNAGASIVQELAFSMAMAADYISRMGELDINVDVVCRHLQFNLSVGSNYFMEIAKIRAARLLWARIIEAFHPINAASEKAIIHSITTEWNQTIYDPYVNVLRATTEAMAAVIGGTDSLSVQAFTSPYKPSTRFSDRIARNIQIILNEEAYLGRIVDPSAGSYYIENLTDSIIQESWKLFLAIEEEGGYLNALKKGSIQKEIENSAQNRRNLVATRKEVLLGTNQYPNLNESALSEIVPEVGFSENIVKDFIVKPVSRFRAAMDFETLRIASEKQPGGKPKVFLLTIGNPVMRKARASFATGFFACAGYKIIDNPGFNSIEEGVKAVFDTKAEIVVICSSDEEYAEIVPAIFKKIANKAIVVVAGAPECMDELKAKGIENFIHVRSNLLETLKEYHSKLNIK